MEGAKKQRAKYCKDQRAAQLIIIKKGDLSSENEKSFTIAEIKTLLRWKKAAKPISQKKYDLVSLYLETPKPKKPTKVWSRGEEEALKGLLVQEEVAWKDTALGVASSQMARAVTGNLDKIDTPTRAALKRSLEEFEEMSVPGVI